MWYLPRIQNHVESHVENHIVRTNLRNLDLHSRCDCSEKSSFIWASRLVIKKSVVRVASFSKETHLTYMLMSNILSKDESPTDWKWSPHLRNYGSSIEMRYQKSPGLVSSPPSTFLFFFIMTQEKKLMPNDSYPGRRKNQ